MQRDSFEIRIRIARGSSGFTRMGVVQNDQRCVNGWCSERWRPWQGRHFFFFHFGEGLTQRSINPTYPIVGHLTALNLGFAINRWRNVQIVLRSVMKNRLSFSISIHTRCLYFFFFEMRRRDLYWIKWDQSILTGDGRTTCGSKIFIIWLAARRSDDGIQRHLFQIPYLFFYSVRGREMDIREQDRVGGCSLSCCRRHVDLYWKPGIDPCHWRHRRRILLYHYCSTHLERFFRRSTSHGNDTHTHTHTHT